MQMKMKRSGQSLLVLTVVLGLGALSFVSADVASAEKTMGELIGKYPVLVFSKSYCPHSKMAKSLITSLYPPAKIIELDQLPDGAELQGVLKSKYKHYTVPAVFLGDKLIGGNSDVQSLHSSGGLKDAIENLVGGSNQDL